MLATPLAAVADQATGSQGAQDTTAASTTHVDGWNKTSEGLEYWQDGQRVCSRWVHDQGVWYYLSDEGLALTGRQTIDGSDYYFDVQTCGMATGWAQDPDGTWFLADGNGALQTGWKRVGGYWYWMDPTTDAMQTGIRMIDGTPYLLTSSGSMAVGWGIDPETGR